MKNDKKIFCTIILCVAVSCAAIRSTFGEILLLGATLEENRELEIPLRIQQNDQVKALCAYGKVIQKNPKNRLSRLFHAHLLMQMGAITKCKEDIVYLESKAPNFRGVLELQVQLGRVTGERQHELAALERTLKPVPKKRPMLAATRAISVHFAKPRIAELRGNLREAEKLWKKMVRDADDTMHILVLSELGEFYLRQEDFSEAVETFKLALKSAQDKEVSGDSISDIKLKLAIALWADEKRNEAMEVTLAVTTKQLSNAIRIDEICAKAVLMGHVLTQTKAGSEAEKKKMRSILEKAAKRFPVGRPYSVESVVLVLTGKLPRDEAIVRIKKVLKAAPHLDWALWAALYLGLSEPEHAKDLLKLLPEKSIQRQIAEVERKAAAIKATTQKAATKSGEEKGHK